MQGIDLSAYYDKISSIRAKILTKHREEPFQVSQKYYKEDRPYVNIVDNTKINSTLAADLRAPLEAKTSNHQNINQRLKQLDSVNQKIKLILANKRQPSATTIKKQTPVTPKKPIILSTPKKITSLFQNQNKILQSKVGPSINNFMSLRQKVFQQRSLRSNSIKNTSQSIICTNQPNKTYKQKQQQQNYMFRFQNFEDKLSLQQQVISMNNDKLLNGLLINRFDQKADISFYNRSKQQKRFEKLDQQKYQKYAPEVKNSISVSGFQGKVQTKKLIQLLSDQIVLDNKLREFKQQFNNLKVQNKWDKFKENLAIYCLQIDDEELKNWIELSAQESNPFSLKIFNSSFSFQQFASHFIDAWRHWNQKVRDSVKISKLQDQDFKIQQIDLGQKGYINIEDLVCFINLNSDSCLRNRDVFCLFKRWNHTNKSEKVDSRLKYQTFLNFVTQ